jgi:hypothetical protein
MVVTSASLVIIALFSFYIFVPPAIAFGARDKRKAGRRPDKELDPDQMQVEAETEQE